MLTIPSLRSGHCSGRPFGRAALSALAVLAMVALLGACAPHTVPTEVTQFHAAPGGPQPGSFTILPLPDQRGSLEFQAHAQRVAEALAAKGFTPQPAAAEPPPDYAVSLTWGAGDTVTTFREAPGPRVFGSTGFYGSSTGFGIGLGFPLGHAPPLVEATTTRTHWLRVVFRPGASPEGANLYEGTSVVTSSSPSIQPVMPYLVDALFTAFPGSNGTTEQVRVPRRP